ncbi:His Kinase A (phospho-acceptor) domain-containing protein [Eubacterium ruminantium]|uniref:histidine kinase n=1 Tax=Eubacterium ruminantium TaxID=42322 RepID=A0A1T4KU30_9FIRM|nr:HAMP domain-containing sensor histidine kinase [Eubacterium ruminantium]SCW34817.1 His Kinase A (phospho-acceptor) domain-containing protein [Eubacterium ruminantium]SDM33835.1 His Kinase A (phospho-acceptor) domain-containing protein [Eubacterium ruminantium]SJZ45949.1 His Kinase A (phospho-acceptor) domain-containing protein [Eubacterium ruminantium]
MIFTNKTIDKLDKMIDDALNGTFSESSYDETRMSRLESKWKEFLGNSVLSNQNLEAERRRLEQFISDISHQTKTPMTNIKMYTELLYEEAVKINTSNRSAAEADKMNSSTHSDTEADKMNSSIHSAGESVRINSSNHSSAELEKSTQKILKYAEEIKRQNQRLEFLIDSLTKLSRLESGTLEVVAEHSDVNELINSAVAAAKPKAVAKNITFMVQNDAGEDGRTASFDMKWTLEALLNVLDNAVKYSPDGGKVTVSTFDTNMYLAIHVVDEGKGISEEDAAKIFGRFYRSSDYQQEEGVGIGLYLTREILSKEDGYIKVIPNDKREGGEFIIYLRK